MLVRVARRALHLTRQNAAHRGASSSSSAAPVGTEASCTIFDMVQSGALHEIPISNIRNFSVIAHVDHGKSTLSDCLLQLTGNISEADRAKGQVCDTLKVERERGITVKAQTASMIFMDDRTKTKYLLNLIDTPGHVDFSYEVSRSLASCQGALLLVDSTQSVQAQTLSNFEKARVLGLAIIPIVTKIDLPFARPVDAALNMSTTFELDPEDVIHTSAKKKVGVLDVLRAIVDRLPSPTLRKTESDQKRTAEGRVEPFYGRIVDSWYDEHRGVVCLVQVVGGQLREGQKITNFASSKENIDIDGGKTEFSVQEVGILTPLSLRTGLLRTGQVGYVIAGLRSTRQARIGDTMFVASEWAGRNDEEITPLTGYAPATPMLFASIYPVEVSELEQLYASVDRLCLNDSSISVSRDHSSSLGAGLRCGFLGFLHMEVFNARLKDEFDMEIVMTTPSVPYEIHYEDGRPVTKINCVSEWPEMHASKGTNSKVAFWAAEPMVVVTMVVPAEFYGAMCELIKERRGEDIETHHLDDGQVKQQSSGYASFNYEEAGFKKTNLVKVEIAVNGDPCDALSFVSHSAKAVSSGRRLALRLKSVLTRQQFEIVLQAKVGAKVIASERIAPYRKDVLIKSGKTVGGGDVSRKKKLLEKQKEGKKRAKMVGKVEIGQEAFWTVLQR